MVVKENCVSKKESRQGKGDGEEGYVELKCVVWFSSFFFSGIG